MILGITPARGGSKGILRKNIKEMVGKPLIAFTIEAVQKSKLVDKYVVSTDDKEIADVSKKYGAEVLMRPEELSRDSVTTLPVLQHVLENIPADIVVLLQCTSPVREEGLIDRCIRKFKEENADSLATGFNCFLEEWGKCEKPRQDVKGFFHDDGNVYVLKADLIKKAKKPNDIFGRKMVKMEISKEQNFEIDDEFDFWLNGQIIKKQGL